jgi:hypothetical protein
MSEGPLPITDPAYWRGRLERSMKKTEPPFYWDHTAIYVCDPSRWKAIEERHRGLLAQTIGRLDGVLDAGCAWGRLLTLMPHWWAGPYLGVDLTPEFLTLARGRHPRRNFLCHDLLKPWPVDYIWGKPFDWAVLISIKQMVEDNLGGEAWETMRINLKLAARKLLILEYDPEDVGSVL